MIGGGLVQWCTVLWPMGRPPATAPSLAPFSFQRSTGAGCADCARCSRRIQRWSSIALPGCQPRPRGWSDPEGSGQ